MTDYKYAKTYPGHIGLIRNQLWHDEGIEKFERDMFINKKELHGRLMEEREELAGIKMAEPYFEMVKRGKKTVETRYNNVFKEKVEVPIVMMEKVKRKRGVPQGMHFIIVELYDHEIVTSQEEWDNLQHKHLCQKKMVFVE